MTQDGPGLPIPPPLRGNEPDTWVERTVKVRMPEIGRRAVRERDWPDYIAAGLEHLAHDIPGGQIELIQDPGAVDSEAWQSYVDPYVGMNWLDVPWFFAETYFYRRLLAASRYFQSGPTHLLDPFGPEKQRGLDQGLREAHPPDAADDLEMLLLAALWGNRADLSLWPAASNGPVGPQPERAGMSRLLVDDRQAALDHIARPGNGPKRIDIVLDNAGQELLSDLALAGGLLARYPGCRLVLHAKSHPTFVSDAIREDVENTLRQSASFGGGTAALAEGLNTARGMGRLEVVAHVFWTSPKAGWEMPADLRKMLGASDLVIFKGDANYRRLVGDRHWPHATPFESVLCYFPAPLLCLRALKANVAIGLEPQVIEAAEHLDGDWMIDGRWALIQFASGTANADL